MNIYFYLALAIFASVIGCSPASDTKIVGKWKGQFTGGAIAGLSRVATENFDKAAVPPNVDVSDEATKTFSAVQVKREFQRDGTVRMESMGEELTGTWKNLGENKYRFVWSGEPPVDVTIEFDGPDAFIESDSAGDSNLRFERERLEARH